VPQVEAWLTYAYTFVGRVVIRMRLTPELEAWGGNIAPEIRPSMRGRGLGTYLFNMALEKARENGLRRVVLTCRTGDEAAMRMFARQGAVEVESASPEVLRFVIEG
jgi:predicted acetyltransferase